MKDGYQKFNLIKCYLKKNEFALVQFAESHFQRLQIK